MESPSKSCTPQSQGVAAGSNCPLRRCDPGTQSPSPQENGPFQVNRYLLDTNIVSELRKQRPHGGVVAWLKGQAEEQLFLSAVTMGELQAGIERTRQQDPAKANEIELWADQVAESFQILPMDTLCFREWGRIVDQMPDQLLEDAMIAATARVHVLIVATRNEADFRRLGVPILNPFKQT